MANRQLKIHLPNLANKTLSQDESQSRINIPLDQSNHNFTKSQSRKKWTLKQSYVQKRISYKKQKLLKPLDVLNTPLSQKIIPQNDDKNMFFTGLDHIPSNVPISREELRNKSIEKSKKFVDIVKSHRKKLLKIRMITEPKHKSYSISAATPKATESKELFNYLQRSFINDKKQDISNTVIQRFKSQSPESVFQKIEEKSRKFLLQKMQKDYINYKQIDNYKKQQIKNLIEEEIQRKKKQFRQDYSKRYSSPYFSFLSLSKEEKSNIILRRQLKSLNSI